jgi:hypothetical protein
LLLLVYRVLLSVFQTNFRKWLDYCTFLNSAHTWCQNIRRVFIHIVSSASLFIFVIQRAWDIISSWYYQLPEFKEHISFIHSHYQLLKSHWKIYVTTKSRIYA